MLKQAIVIALAFMGLIIGAGFASGQELLVYFIAFGVPGIWGALAAAVLFALSGYVVMQLGSYFHAKEHSAVFDEVSHPIVSRMLDVFTILVLFTMGFVMIAGAGANFHQQYGLPTWVGSIVLVGLIIFAGMLDVDKVTTVIGLITPFILIFIVLASIHAFTDATLSISALEPVAKEHLTPAISSLVLSTVNYVTMSMALAISMALVMGGNLLNTRVAGLGGLIGGGIFGIILMLAVLAIFTQVDKVYGAPMPMLEVVNQIHPLAGIAMAVIVYGMIFNTAIGLYYALAKRVTSTAPKLFLPAIVIFSFIGFGLSFFGFESLVGTLYPMVGYVGIIMMGILGYAWFTRREAIKQENKIRNKIRKLLRVKWDVTRVFTRKHEAALVKALDASNVDSLEQHREVSAEVVAEIEEDDNADVEPAWEAISQQWEEEAEAVENGEDFDPENVDRTEARVQELEAQHEKETDDDENATPPSQ
ncbi:hypothetical protein JTE88_04905 [Arcanobacterium phocisimile]|uniref:Membrane protein YkvI n=1 Tax=Arcanobacterium phocisimile TaxID=1302235 RepID=A0ABX7IIR1_9ACTO|nr:hypothetical protein JTE88_04905 [Arcanobacterium phocisimile]